MLLRVSMELSVKELCARTHADNGNRLQHTILLGAMLLEMGHFG